MYIILSFKINYYIYIEIVLIMIGFHFSSLSELAQQWPLRPDFFTDAAKARARAKRDLCVLSGCARAHACAGFQIQISKTQKHKSANRK